LFQYSELVRNLTVKEFKLRYRNSVLGFFWSLLNPVAMMIILTLVFSALLKSQIWNFPVFVLTALLAWRFFSIGTSMSLWSIIGNSPLVTKVYFPRWLLVLSSNLANLLGSVLEFAALFLRMNWPQNQANPEALILKQGTVTVRRATLLNVSRHLEQIALPLDYLSNLSAVLIRCSVDRTLAIVSMVENPFNS